MILASEIIKTILVKSYKGASCILWDFKIYAWGWGWGSEGAHWVSSLLQLQPAGVAVASIRYMGH